MIYSRLTDIPVFSIILAYSTDFPISSKTRILAVIGIFTLATPFDT